jgi:cyclopropane-fatty-acyl-phospholipid synthase
MRLAEVFEQVVGEGAPVQFRGFDGSLAGPADAEVRVDVKSARALSYLATSPGDVGLARAYIMGDLDVDGDLYTAMASMIGRDLDLSWSTRWQVFQSLGGLRLLRRPPRPPEEVRLRGRRHSKARDAAAIAHHYDVSNRFYEWLLGPSMACALFPAADTTLEQAQFAKHDLVARKLGLRPGQRLLDVGCGWGGMVMHAARHYGVRALGVTLSRRQAEWAQKTIASSGLADLAEVRHLDYRDVPESGFDVISSIGLTEHIGKAQLPGYFRFLYEKLIPGGRLLNHCITRPNNLEPAARKRHFINRYIFPDGELEGVGHLISVMHDTGFEVRHEENLREHYARTLAGWSANLEAHWEESVAEVGLGRARTWRLYLVGSRLGFERNQIQLHQVLCAKPDAEGRSHAPLRPIWEPPATDPEQIPTATDG